VIALVALAAVIAARGGVAEPETKVIGFEYAFTVPAELPAGRRAFLFENRGKARHELNISLLKRGATIEQFIAAANANRPLTPFIDAPVGVLFAERGGSAAAALSVDLRAGRTYAVLCIIRDAAGKPRHHELGMYAAIHVRSAPPAAPATEFDVDTITAMDYAFRNVSPLRPGVHYFYFVNAGKHRHEVGLHLLKKGVTLRRIMDVDKVDGDIAPYIDRDLGVLHAHAGTSPAGMLRVDVLPGREYMLDCGFSDTEKSPPHYKLGMYGTILGR
jgi:hypothetical protein